MELPSDTEKYKGTTDQGQCADHDVKGGQVSSLGLEGGGCGRLPAAGGAA